MQTTRSIATAHRQASLDAQTGICSAHMAQAHLRTIRLAGINYRETEERRKWRNLFELAAELPDTVLAVTFLKRDGEPRTMLAQPVRGGDPTRRYALVWDLEEEAHRRVNLDGIVKVTIETHACGVAQAH